MTLDPKDVCPDLRWKGRQIDIVHPARLAEVFIDNSVPYSCLRTCQPWGPDDGLAAPERCGAGRGCFSGEGEPIS